MLRFLVTVSVAGVIVRICLQRNAALEYVIYYPKETLPEQLGAVPKAKRTVS